MPSMRLLLLLALVSPLAANDLRSTLTATAGEAGVTLVLDRSVAGTVDADGLSGPAMARLDQLAARAGLTVTRADPGDGKPVLMLSAGGNPAAQAAVQAVQAAGAAESAPAHAGHKVARKHRKHVAKAPACERPECARPVCAPVPLQVDAMVVAVPPGTIGELAAEGRELAPASGQPAVGTEFLDGPGPGLKVMAFDGVEPRLNEHLPWAEVGSHHDGRYVIKNRQRIVLSPNGQLQVPLESARVLEEPTHREAIVKQALVVRASALPGGRVRIQVALRKGVAFPEDVDPAMFTGGRLCCTADVSPGQEVVVTGLGVSAPAPAERCAPSDPFDRYRRPRLLDRDRHDRAAACAPCGDIVVRLLIRPRSSL